MAFFRGNDLKAHVDRIHKHVKYPCDICKKELSSKRELQDHKETVHEGKTNNHCKVCGKRYGRERHLRRHILTMHTNIKGRENIRAVTEKVRVALAKFQCVESLAWLMTVSNGVCRNWREKRRLTK